MNIKRLSVGAVLSLALLLASLPVLASDIDQQARMDLFLASQWMLKEAQRPPKMRVGLIMTNLGDDPQISFGVKVESSLGEAGKLRAVTETIYLKEERTIAGFLSLKYVESFASGVPPLYVGAGVGYAHGFRYQVFAGIEVTKNFFAELRYINMPGGFGSKGLYVATGFQFLY